MESIGELVNGSSLIQNGNEVATKESKKFESLDIKIDILDSEEAFDFLEGEWNPLVAKADAPIYVTREWITYWWKHFGRHPKRNPFIITLRRDGVLIGLAPLFEGKSSIGPLNLERRLHLMGSGVGEQELLGFHDEYGRSDFLDILAEPEQEEEVARCLVAFLQQDNLNFDLIALQHLRDEGFTKRVLLPQLEEQHIDYEIENTDICPYVTLSEFDTLEEYIGELSSNTRRRLRQTLRAIGEEDGYELEEVETVDQLLEELEILRNMHQERWNGFGYPGAFFDRRFVRFMEEFVQVAYDKGWIWFKQAIDESGHAATRLSLKFNNRFYDYMSGFDDSSPSTKYRPGIGLLTVMIKEAIENGSPEIVELLRGDEGYKFDLTSQVKKNWRVSIPLRSNRSLIRKALSGLLKTAAAVHAAVQREWTLMKVQRHLEGPARMVFSYITTRYNMLKYKYQQD